MWILIALAVLIVVSRAINSATDRADGERRAKEAAIEAERTAARRAEQASKDATLLELLALADAASAETRRLFAIYDPRGAAEDAAQTMLEQARTYAEKKAADALKAAAATIPYVRTNPHGATLVDAICAHSRAPNEGTSADLTSARQAFDTYVGDDSRGAERRADAYAAFDTARARCAAATRACLQAVKDGASPPPRQ